MDSDASAASATSTVRGDSSIESEYDGSRLEQHAASRSTHRVHHLRAIGLNPAVEHESRGADAHCAARRALAARPRRIRATRTSYAPGFGQRTICGTEAARAKARLAAEEAARQKAKGK